MEQNNNEQPNYAGHQQQQGFGAASGQELGSGLDAASVSPPPYQREPPDDIVQVVYQSNQSGNLVGVESTLLSGGSLYQHYSSSGTHQDDLLVDVGGSTVGGHHQLSRAASTLPSVAEESTTSGGGGGGSGVEYSSVADGEGAAPYVDDSTTRSVPRHNEDFDAIGGSTQPIGDHQYTGADAAATYTQPPPHYLNQQELGHDYANYEHQQQAPMTAPAAIYSTIKRGSRGPRSANNQDTETAQVTDLNTASNVEQSPYEQIKLSADYNSIAAYYQATTDATKHSSAVIDEIREEEEENNQQQLRQEFLDPKDFGVGDAEVNDDYEKHEEDYSEEISHILSRNKQGAAESGSFRHNFKKKLGMSVSTNEKDLIAHRQKLLEAQEANINSLGPHQQETDDEAPGSLPSFKRTHSVSFAHGSRNSRHSVDIRNLPSYLTVKRASIVDVAKGAMSSLMQSLGGSSNTSRRDSSPDEELPIFEEPIAPTLSLGQRVALVRPNGTEFGTVGWIGQLPEVDYDWIVGVIFDNMIGNCDGEHNGVRYFYSRENYAMFVPLSSLTKTDNYIGRPETGTMLSRMSVQLKPGQLISIQRSNIRLQHCFLNAPHQRVGHDVRAVSNRLHCQCHNCGPCAHLTKQGNRFGALPAFGGHHAPNKKNSLAHAAVEILAHHHHHYHEEEHKQHHEDYQFGDNAAHACNFVRYSCCQQNGQAGHDFSADCQMVRPELLDNLIHAPRAPHRPQRLRRTRRYRNQQLQQQRGQQALGYQDQNNKIESNVSTLDGTIKSWPDSTVAVQQQPNENDADDDSGASYSTGAGSSGAGSRSVSPQQQHQQTAGYYSYDTTSTQRNLYNTTTLESRMSVLEQQRFIYQPESVAFSRSPYSDTGCHDGQSGFGSSIRRCFNCLLGRSQTSRGRGKPQRPKKRKLSARHRMIEYRRKQSTFVPSTLAKPQEDFASHGIVLPGQLPLDQRSNSDYSSYSRSNSNHSSPNSSSPDHHGVGAGAGDQQTMSMDYGMMGPTNNQLKSQRCERRQEPRQINFGDYTFSEDSYKKNILSATISDQGFDSWTTNGSSSYDTFKDIIKQAINDEVAPPEPILDDGQQGEVEVSPLSATNTNDTQSQESHEQVEVSSPTASTVDNEDVCTEMSYLNLNNNDHRQD